MTNKENIKAILECNFAGFKNEIIDIATERILSLEQQQTEKCCETCKYNGVFSLECGRCDDDMTRYATRQQPCEDAVSREAILKKQYSIDDSATLSTRDVVNVEDIEDAPPVTVRQIGCDKCAMNGSGSKYCDNCKYKRQTGEWIALEEWKNDFKGFINELSIPKDDYNGIMEYIDEVPNSEGMNNGLGL